MTTDKLLEAIYKVDTGRYKLELEEVQTIAEEYGGDPYGGIVAGYRYGFLKGRRAERADARKKARREMEQHARGYGLLMALIQKNRSNEQFIRRLCTRARSMDDMARKKAEEKERAS